MIFKIIECNNMLIINKLYVNIHGFFILEVYWCLIFYIFTMNKSKLKKLLSLLRICKTLNKDDLNFFIQNTSNDSIQLILEVVYNLIFNENLVNRVKNDDLLKSVKSSMTDNRKKWCSVIKSDNVKSKNRFIQTQVGSGVLMDICSLVLPIILTML